MMKMKWMHQLFYMNILYHDEYVGDESTSYFILYHEKYESTSPMLYYFRILYHGEDDGRDRDFHSSLTTPTKLLTTISGQEHGSSGFLKYPTSKLPVT